MPGNSPVLGRDMHLPAFADSRVPILIFFHTSRYSTKITVCTQQTQRNLCSFFTAAALSIFSYWQEGSTLLSFFLLSLHGLPYISWSPPPHGLPHLSGFLPMVYPIFLAFSLWFTSCFFFFAFFSWITPSFLLSPHSYLVVLLCYPPWLTQSFFFAFLLWFTNFVCPSTV